MKRLNYLLTAVAFLVIVTTTSCSKSDDGCHECHIALENADGSETMWEMTNSSEYLKSFANQAMILCSHHEEGGNTKNNHSHGME